MTAPSRTTPDQPTGPVGARRSVDPARRGPDGAPDLAAGRILAGRYRIDGEIGRGGMATVYRARDQELERDVAIKVLHRRDLTGEQGRRLLREARAVAALNHPHIVTIHDVGLEGEIPFIIMELVDGNNLRQLARAPLGRVVEIACQLCRALEHVHARQMVHRDLKPENVLVTWDGDAPTVKLADLGIALSRAHTRQTEAGTLVGTALYLAPEQALGRPVDARADLYALGVVLYELIAGRPPFEGDDPLTIVSQHLHAPVVAPRAFRPDLPSALESIVVDLLSKDPARRPGSAREVLARFDGLASTSPASGPAAARAPIDRQVDAGDASDTDLPSGDYVALLDELVRGRLVGRSTELAELRDLWRRAGQGHGHIALVSGEPGVGKTRLARELVAQAQFEGAEVLAGGCYEYDATTPYLPFVEALRAWVQRQDDATLAEKVGPIACELVRLAPEIADRLPGIEEPPRLEPHEERLRLFDSVARFLRTLAAERGLLVWLEDLQWADQGTIALLHDILRHLRDARLLVLGTYREVELDRVHPLSRALIDWNRGRLATRVQLGRLTPDGTGAVLATLLGQDSVSGSFVTAIHAETDGNPFFLEETVKALIEQGQIHRHDGEWIACDVQQLTVPQSVRAAIGRRLDRLDASSLEVLHTAAVIGKVFTFDEMRAASPSGEDELLDALDVASAAQLIELLPGESFAFTHDKIREVLYEELNPVRRRRLHRRFAEGLEHQLGQRADEHAQDLAHHYLQGGAIESGMRHAIAAARRAERVYAHDEAIECLARARECAEELEDTEVSRDIEERLAAVHAARGDSDATARHLEQALARCQAPSERLALQARIGEAYASTGDPRGPEYLEEAIAGLDPDRQPLELARATAMMGRFHHYAGDHRRSAELIGRAIELAGPH
ncbi:MAG: protein kinase, partial [Candidatus Eiseniibacteriota bacterium]